MNNSMISSSVTLSSLQQKLDIISNNMANIDTNGFKRKLASFQDVLTNVKEQPSGFKQPGRSTPLGVTQGFGAKLNQVQVDMAQGTIEPTGDPMNLAIEGDGLFEVSLKELDATGATVTTRAWTRDGSFQLSLQPGDTANGYLSTGDGNLVMGIDDQPIKVPNGERITIDAGGNIFANTDGQPPQEVGTLKVMRILKPQSLENAGNNLYKVSDIITVQDALVNADAGNANVTNPIVIRQGFLEKSNVNLSDEMTELLIVQRAYQLNSRALTNSDTMANLANNLRG